MTHAILDALDTLPGCLAAIGGLYLLAMRALDGRDP
jgi:hypothetical protein